MAFDMKYDRDGTPIKTSQPEPIEQPITQQETEEAPIEQDVQEQQVQQEPEASSVTPESKKESAAAESFKELRLQKERAERERDELIRMIKEQQQVKQSSTAEPEEDIEVNIGSDDLVEGKHLSKVGKKIKKLEEELNKQRQQSSEVMIERKLKETYSDFDSVVSRENIEALRANFPEIANTINSSSSDLYSKAVSAYTMIKKLGIAKEPEVYSEEKEKLKANAAKPRPLASVSPLKGESPLSHANAFAKGLTKELQEQLRKEMDEARRQM